MSSPTDAIKEKLNITDVIGEYIELTPGGANSKARCPFHTEKTPSFMVSPSKQIWHCFGCGEGGDIFTFIMKIEGIEFPEALRLLANKAGVPLPKRNPQLENQRTKLLDILKTAASFYHVWLNERPEADPMRRYLQSRRVGAETIERFRLGAAPDAWDGLNTFLVQRGYREEEVFLAGLTVRRETSEGYYDRFRNRLLFPITDYHGSVVGFGGRTLDPAESAKYINSPQSMIYDKSRIVFGLSLAKEEIRSQQLAVIVEGYMDVLASHQAGVGNVVAASGTALTVEQVKLIERLTPNVALCFDADEAGKTAAGRGIEAALSAEANTRIIRLPEGSGKDPDECIQKDPQVWRQAIRGAEGVMEYLFSATTSGLDLTRVEDKKTAAAKLLPWIARIADPIERTHWLQELGRAIRVDETVLAEKARSIARSRQLGQSLRVPPAATVVKQVIGDRFGRLAREVVGLALRLPDQLDYLADTLIPEIIPDDEVRELYRELILYYTTTDQPFSSEVFVKHLEATARELAQLAGVLTVAAESTAEESTPGEVARLLRDAVTSLKRHAIGKELSAVEAALGSAESAHDKQATAELSDKFVRLTEALSKLD